MQLTFLLKKAHRSDICLESNKDPPPNVASLYNACMYMYLFGDLGSQGIHYCVHAGLQVACRPLMHCM